MASAPRPKCLSVGATCRLGLCEMVGGGQLVSITLRRERVTCPACLTVLDWLEEQGHLPKVKTLAEYSVDVATKSYPKGREWSYSKKPVPSRVRGTILSIQRVEKFVTQSLKFYLSDFPVPQ